MELSYFTDLKDNTVETKTFILKVMSDSSISFQNFFSILKIGKPASRIDKDSLQYYLGR